MSKRKERGGQRLNRELLERARQQAQAIEEEAEAVEESESETSAMVVITQKGTTSAPRRSTANRIRARNEEARKRALTAEDISYLLANPTKLVSSEELQEQYGFVLRDLRSMGLLAAASFGVLLVLAFILPK